MLTQEDRMKIVDMRMNPQKRFSTYEIAEVLGVSHQYISEFLNQLCKGKPKGSVKINYPAVTEWLTNNKCTLEDFAAMADVPLGELSLVLSTTTKLPKAIANTIMAITGIPEENLYAKNKVIDSSEIAQYKNIKFQSIKDYLIENNLQITWLADECGLPYGTVYSALTTKSKSFSESKRKIAEVLKMPVEVAFSLN